ncbi:MAG: 3-demethylubiquinone-9 3-O-methyltransferase [uncultured bacterium]|nr:MAG: 3-demethylubiquinone-9 3-O-methyltransferase [uncultured bacterium]
MKLLHDLNPLRLDYIKKFTCLNHKNILDIGCGGGILTESLTQSHAVATGIDLTESLIHIAKKHAEKNHLATHYELISAEDFAEKNPGQFDLIACMEMLEHVPHPISIIQAISKLLKPNGLVFFSTINRNFKSFMSAIIAAEYILNLLPKKTHHYDKLIKPSELTNWCESKNLILENIQGLSYNIFTKKFNLTHSVDVNYLICFKKIA